MRLLWGLLVGMGLTFLAIGTVQAGPQNDAIVRPAPSLVEVSVQLGNGALELEADGTASLAVAVADVTDLYGFEMHLRFDPVAVEVVDADSNRPGIQVAPGDFLTPDFVVQNRADNQAGTLDLAVTQLNPSAAKNGSGTLFTVQFRGVSASRQSQIEVISGALASRDGLTIPATFGRADVSVWGTPGASPTLARPTATPLPVATSTPTSASADPTREPEPGNSQTPPVVPMAATATSVTATPTALTTEPATALPPAGQATPEALDRAAASQQTSGVASTVAMATMPSPASLDSEVSGTRATGSPVPPSPTPARLARVQSEAQSHPVLPANPAARESTGADAPAGGLPASLLQVGGVAALFIGIACSAGLLMFSVFRRRGGPKPGQQVGSKS